MLFTLPGILFNTLPLKTTFSCILPTHSLFFFKFVKLFWSLIWVAQWLKIYILYYVITSLVTICYPAKLLHYYWLYSPSPFTLLILEFFAVMSFSQVTLVTTLSLLPSPNEVRLLGFSLFQYCQPLLYSTYITELVYNCFV